MAVRLTMLGVGLVQTAVVCAIVLSSGFLQDDYLYFQIARTRGFTLQGMTTSVFGSIIPGFMFVNTALSTQHPIPRYQAELIVIALYAAIVFILYRLLELLFGARPAVVCLTAIATCSGLLGISVAWWTPGINSLPAVAADLLALDGLARHALTGKRRHLVVSVISFAIATLFYDPSMTLIVMLVLFTMFYLAEPGGWRPVGAALWRRRWVWIGYAVPIAVNLAWRESHSGEYMLPVRASWMAMLRFMGAGWAQGFAPSSIGVNYSTLGLGAWRWEVVALGQALVLGLVVVSIVRRSTVWRAWVLFGSSFLVADLVAATGRATLPTFFALNSLYWLFYGFLFWMAVGLAFMPSHLPGSWATAPHVRNPAPRHAKHRGPSPAPAALGVVATVTLCLLGIHYLWTTPDRALGAENASFVANVRKSWQIVSGQQPSAFVWNSAVPAYVLSAAFSPFNRVSSTVGLVVTGIRIDAAQGQGYMVAYDGQLQPAHREVVASLAARVVTRQGQICLGPTDTAKLYALPLTARVPKSELFVRVGYSQSSGFPMTFDGQTLSIPKGSGALLVPWTYYTASAVYGFALPAHSSVCLSLDVERPIAPAG